MKQKVFIFLSLFMVLTTTIYGQQLSKHVTGYEIEGAGTGAQGTYVIKISVISKKNEVKTPMIAKCAVHGILFKGFSNKELRQSQKPLAGSPIVEQEHADFFNDFFADNGAFINYVQFVESSRSVVKLGKKEFQISVNVVVNKEQLRKDLEKAGVIKGLSTGF